MSSKPRKKYKKNTRRVEPPTPEQVARIAAAAGREHHPLGVAALLAAYSGIRFNEGRMMDWCDLEEVPGATYARLHVRWGKGDNGSGPRPRTTILLPEGLEAVRSLAGYGLQVPDAPMLMQVRGRAAGKRFAYRTLSLGVARGRDAAGEDVGHFIFHDFRKFYASRLLNAGVSEMDVAVALGHIDRQGRPNTDLVRRVYGFVHLRASLDRVAEVMTGGGVVREVVGAASRGVVEGESGAPGAGAAEGGYRGRGGVAVGRLAGAGAGVRDDEGVVRVACDAEGRARQGGQDPAYSFRVSLEDARRSKRAAAGGAGGGVPGAV